MTVKNWAQAAAEEIANGMAEGDSARFVEGLTTIIQEHCPFKTDIAYMPVPRCETCKYWERFELETIGKCLEVDRTILFSASKCGLETREEFGCVRWKEK